jgi:hypothetical protein
MEHAEWEGADLTLVFVDRNGKNIKIQPLGKRSVNTAVRMSYDKPIGIIAKNEYSGKGGRWLKNFKYAVYYKGRNVETLGAKDLDHPHIRMIEESLHRHDLRNEHSTYLPGVEYERGMDADDMLFPKRSKSMAATISRSDAKRLGDGILDRGVQMGGRRIKKYRTKRVLAAPTAADFTGMVGSGLILGTGAAVIGGVGNYMAKAADKMFDKKKKKR